MLVAEPGRSRPLDARQNLVSHHLGVVEALQQADVRAEGRSLRTLAVAGDTAAGGRHQHVGDAEVRCSGPCRTSTFWTFSKLMVVSWMVMMPRLMRRLRSVSTYHVVS